MTFCMLNENETVIYVIFKKQDDFFFAIFNGNICKFDNVYFNLNEQKHS